MFDASEPVYPYGVSILKSFGFICGIAGCVIELLNVYEVLHFTDEQELMLLIVAVIGIFLFRWFFFVFVL